MQSVARGLRIATRRTVCVPKLQPHQIASTSRVQWDTRRSYAMNPIEWFRRSMSPQVREKDSTKEVEEAREKLRESGEGSLFDQDDALVDDGASPDAVVKTKKQKATSHKYSTATLTISHRKLNLLGRQISGKPIDTAIMQMAFSEKRISNRVKNMLVVARNHATDKGLEREKLVVSEAWVNKGPGGRMAKRMEIKGRGKMGIRMKYKAKMHVVLKEGLSIAEQKEKLMEKKLRRIVSAGLVREDQPLRNPRPAWAW